MEYRVFNQTVKNETDFLLQKYDDWSRGSYNDSGRMYQVLFLKKGTGTLTYEFNCYRVNAPCVLFISAYQPFRMEMSAQFNGDVLSFATDFFCIDHNHSEVGCQGLLFNNAYDAPYLTLNDPLLTEMDDLLDKIRKEFITQQTPDSDLISTYIKLFLKISVREKKQQVASEEQQTKNPDKPILARLKQLIEQHYRVCKSPSEYAGMLSISPKALGKLVKDNFGRTLTDMIRERVVYEAKYQLFNTDKSVKEIATGLGYDDPFYFSRLFKNVTSVSPEKYRQTIHY
jgi:AraC family transcriptional regulator, transcriptional activator of pobA